MRGTASLAVLAVLVAGPAFADTVIGGDPPVPIPTVPQLPSTPVPVPAPPAPAPDPTPVVDQAQQTAAATQQQATDAVNSVVAAATTGSRTQGPGTGATAGSGPSAPAAAPRLTRHAPQPASSHRQPASRHKVRSVPHARASGNIATTAPAHHAFRARRHRVAPHRHVVVHRRVVARAVPALPVLAPTPPHPGHARPAAHHGGIHHSLAMPLPLSKRGMLIGLGLILALTLLALRFFAVDVLPNVRAGIAARRHPW